MPFKEKILKHNAQVPRYTSYPTAPHFGDISEDTYVSSLKNIDATQAVSIYVHVPFCTEMCWYCGCHTTATKKYAPVEDYVALLLREIRNVASSTEKKLKVAHLHFGGGSPTMLQPDDFHRIVGTLKEIFNFSIDAEIAIEADPRSATHDKVEAYRDCGIKRASFGVQDFSPAVQKAINRVQNYETVQKACSLFRQFGIDRINFDLMYGLPGQTLDDVTSTVEKSLSLSPKRIALFGYAHVPWMKKHMRLIRDENLPDARMRIDQFSLAERMLTNAGMTPLGLDHFVAQDDDMLQALRQRRLARNFQGYTTDDSSTLIGFGMSAIGRTQEGFFQNYPNITEYSAAVLKNKIPVYRGRLVTDQDRLRSDVISDLMCYLSADLAAILQRHEKEVGYFDGILKEMSALVDDGLITIQDRILTVSPAARQAVRVAASRFDAYFSEQKKKHVQTA